MKTEQKSKSVETGLRSKIKKKKKKQTHVRESSICIQFKMIDYLAALWNYNSLGVWVNVSYDSQLLENLFRVTQR